VSPIVIKVQLESFFLVDTVQTLLLQLFQKF
jgi:hypothetical protein